MLSFLQNFPTRRNFLKSAWVGDNELSKNVMKQQFYVWRDLINQKRRQWRNRWQTSFVDNLFQTVIPARRTRIQQQFALRNFLITHWDRWHATWCIIKVIRSTRLRWAFLFEELWLFQERICQTFWDT